MRILSQEFELDEEATVQQNILNGAADILATIEEYESLDPASGKAAQLEQQISHLDG